MAEVPRSTGPTLLATTTASLFTAPSTGSSWSWLSSILLCNVTGLDAPVANTPSTATTGGTLAAGTYYYRVAALDARGQTVASNEVSVTTTGATSTVTVTWGAVTGATGYRIYRGTAAGSQTVYYTVGAVTTFTDTNATPTNGQPQFTNSTGLEVSVTLGTGTANTDASAKRIAHLFRLMPGQTLEMLDRPIALAGGASPELVYGLASAASSVTCRISGTDGP